MSNVTGGGDNSTYNEAIYTTQDHSTDFVYSSYADIVGLATVCIWAYLIPHFYIEYSEYRMALMNSPTWGSQPEKLLEAKRALNFSFYFNIGLGIVLFGGSSTLINWLTWEMDRRASDIVTGSSRLFAGWIFMLLSINIPQWMGCYFSFADTYKTKLTMFRTTREIKFNFSWTLWRHLATMFFFNLYFSCRTYEFTTLYGFLVGVPMGAFFIFVVFLARVKFPARKRWWGFFFGSALVVVSIFCVIAGAIYIEDTWHEDYENQQYSYGNINYTLLISILWGIFVLALHLTAIFITKKYENNENVRSRYQSTVFQTGIPGLKLSNKGSNHDGSNSKKNPDADGDDGDAAPEQAHGDDENGKDMESDVNFEMPELKTGKNTRDFLATNEEAPSCLYLCRVKMLETYGCCCCGCCPCCCKDIKEDNNLNNDRMHHLDQLKQKNKCWRIFDGFKLFLWYCLSAFLFYLTIVNCGATSQQTIVRNNLNNAFEYLYPVNYQTGPMCGWSEPNENGEIRSFDTLEELQAANFTLIHCGYCGECSNWNDLSIQWTTRTFLAEVAKKCAQKSLFGGIEEVQACNEAEPIGFTPGCAECWTVDELCAKNNCFWIFLQSTLINAVSDYRVQLNDITSATCDESLCGPEFVPCSGATRRRMNIKSDIERPYYQQCVHQDADWSVIFNHP